MNLPQLFRDLVVAVIATAGVGLIVIVLWGDQGNVREDKLAQTVSHPDHCFGIPNDFSGRLSEKQERNAVKELRNAFYIESVQPITADGLARECQMKSVIAEETRGTVKYFALQDFRCVMFGEGRSGQMIVIERYKVTDAK